MSFKWSDISFNGCSKTTYKTLRLKSKSSLIQIFTEDEVQQGLSLAHIPVSLTLALTDNNLIADPSSFEDRVAKSRITVTMNVYK